MAKMQYEDFLAHYGVLGMKWGVRKREERVANRQAKRAERSSAITKKASKAQRDLDLVNRLGTKSPYMIKKYGPAMRMDTPASDMHIQLLNFGRSKETLLAAEKKNLAHKRDHFLADAKLALAGKLTQKTKMLIGAGIALALIGGTVGAVLLKDKMQTEAIAELREKVMVKIQTDKFEAEWKARMANIEVDNAAEDARQLRLDNMKPGDIMNKSEWWDKLVETEMDRVSGISQDAFEGMPDTPITVPPGRVFHRISRDKEEVLRDKLFASLTDDDAERYKATMPIFWDKSEGYSYRENPSRTAFQVAMKNVQEIRSPGEKTRVQEYINLLNKKISDDPKLMEHAKFLNKNRGTVLKSPKIDLNGTVRDMLDRGQGGDLTNEEFGLEFYRNFALGLAQDSPVNSAYFDALRQQGFNAVIDDNDAGKLSDMPFNLFDANKTMERIGAKMISNAEIKQAQANIKELLNRR